MDSITAVMGTDLSLLDCPLYMEKSKWLLDPMHLKPVGPRDK